MSITIYSVVPKRLIEDAKRIEKHAEDQLEAWIALGQSDKYAKAVDQARILRLAANGKDVYSRRAFLKIAGFTVKNLDKTPKENPIMKTASPAQLAARKRFAEMARSGAFKKATKRKANPTNRPIIKAAMNIRELAYDLENISQDDKKQISDYTDAEILHEAKYVLEIYHESGTVSNDALMGEHGKDEQKSARDDVRKLKTLIAKFNTTTSRKTNPTETGMRYQIFKSNGPLDSEYKTLAQMQSALDEIDRKPSGRYYGYDKAFGRTYHSFAHNQPSAVVKNNPMHKYTVLHRGTANVAGQVTASGPQAAKQKVAEKLGIPTLAYLVAKKTNPAKKTVSKKISQLVHEGYPQRQAVAVALSEQRAGKVKRNPRPEKSKKYYQVSIMEEGTHTKFMPMALYFTFAEAENYANYLAKQHKNWTIRVHDTRAM